jgi:hypothetical protein
MFEFYNVINNTSRIKVIAYIMKASANSCAKYFSYTGNFRRKIVNVIFSNVSYIFYKLNISVGLFSIKYFIGEKDTNLTKYL